MKKTAMLFVLVLLIGGLAGEASAFGWKDIRGALGMKEEVREMNREQERVGEDISELARNQRNNVQRGIAAINQNQEYLRVAEHFGYNSVCLEIEGSETEQKYLIARQQQGVVFAEGCAGEDFTAKITEQAFEQMVEGLESGNQAVLAQAYRQGHIRIPWRVKLNVVRKCLFSSVC